MAKQLIESFQKNCFALASHYIANATRFQNSVVELISATSQFHELKIWANFTFDVEINENIYPGIYSISEHDFLTDSPAEYKRLTNELKRLQSSDYEFFSQFLVGISKADYGSLRTKTEIYFNPAKAIFSYDCTTCSAEGVEPCRVCFQDGKIPCESCGGSGERACVSCGGSGVKLTTHYRTINGRQQSYVSSSNCLHCFAGSIRCSSCTGTGWVDCHNCNGCGMDTCSNCNGHGNLSRVAQITTAVTPQFSYASTDPRSEYLIDSIFSKINIANIGMHEHLALIDALSHPKDLKGTLSYSCQLLVCTLELQVDGAISTWKVFGSKSPKILDSDGAIENLLLPDIEDLHSCTRFKTLLSPLYPWIFIKSISRFMLSPINREIFRLHNGEGGIEFLSCNKFHNAISPNYIEEGFVFLRAGLRGLLYWASLYFVIGISCVSIVFGYAIVFIEQTYFPLNLPNGNETVVLFPSLHSAITPWIVIFLTCCIIVYFISNFYRRLLTKLGGVFFVQWATANKLTPSKPYLYTLIGFCWCTCLSYFLLFPVWVNKAGALYGQIPIFEPLKTTVFKNQNISPLPTPRAKEGSIPNHPGAIAPQYAAISRSPGVVKPKSFPGLMSQSAPEVRYYCNSPPGYFPEVSSCSGGWVVEKPQPR